ncbi:MAG: GAF domain-containing protein [Sulfurimonas sp.]|nr:GAF domain-containing protein [Sulfurimonas sp.]MDD3060497.1 GAF domain-containing protein [Sulfurimonas sp.]
MKYADTYSKLAEFGRELLRKPSLVEGLPLISKYAKDVIHADRCSVFIYDLDKKELWTTLADGVEKIKVASDKGIVGHTLSARKPILENEPYKNIHFLPEIDKETRYTTNNIITAPIFNSKREIIGILELLNKEGGFDMDDVKFITFFANYVSGSLELVLMNKK